jgi:signal transduction histidine kinase
MAVQEAGRVDGLGGARESRRAARASRGAILRRTLLAGVAAGASGAMSGAALADFPAISVDLAQSIEAYSAVALSVFVALGVFSTVTAFLYVRERDRWQARAGDYEIEIARLREEADRAEMLLADDVQLLVAWSGPDIDPMIEGDVAAITGAPTARRALAFGAWLAPADAKRLEDAVTRLRDAGEPFLMQMRSRADVQLEAAGRVVAGRAIMRVRDVGEERRLRQEAESARDAALRDRDALRGLIDALPHPVWLRDASRRLSWVNRAYVRAVEATNAEDAIARELELLDHRQRADADARHAAGDSYARRTQAVIAGRRATIDAFETRVNGLSGGVAVDASELAALQDDFDRQLKANALTLDQLPTAVAIFDAQQTLAFHNQAYRHLWNLDVGFLDQRPTESELLDRLRARRMIPEHDDFRTWKSGWLQGYRTLEPRDQVWYLPDGRNIRVFANPNPQGGITYLFDDMTERHALETRYNAMMRVQGETLDMLKEGVAVFSSDGKLRLTNPAFSQMWGIPPAVLRLNPHVDDVVRLAAIQAPGAGFWSDMAGAVAGLADQRLGVSARIARPDDSIIDCAIAPLPDGGTLVTFTDVTASARVERALTDRNDALQRAEQLRNDFVKLMSYELRSPLNVVIGYTQMLGDGIGGSLNDKQREYASHIMRASNALLALIDNILDLQSIDSGSVTLEPGPVDLRASLDAIAESVEERLRGAKLDLRTTIDPAVGAFIADARRMRTVLFNLVSNAIGFSPEGGVVGVDARRIGDELVITVSDQGPGIPESAQALVFERFEHHARGSRHRGLGIGLSIVRSFIELHGGRVAIDSGPDRGTRVVCAIPYRDAEPAFGAAARLLA